MERFVPDGYEPLEKAVFLVAQARNPSLWDGLHPVEGELYQRLGRSIHAEALHGLLVRALGEAAASEAAVASAQRRITSYLETQGVLRVALEKPLLASVLQVDATGERMSLEAREWASQNAPNWFKEGRVFIPDGTKELIGHDFWAEEADAGTWASIIIPLADLTALLASQSAGTRQLRSDNVVYHTGSPGRPSSKHIWMAEARRRLDRGEVEQSRRRFSTVLAEWLHEENPELPRVTPKTIYNDGELASLWRDAEHSARKPARNERSD